MRFSICLIDPAGYKYSHFLYDACKYFCYTIEALGYDCCMVRNRLCADRINIVLGSHNLIDPSDAEKIKQSGKYVIVQSEVLKEGSVAGWGAQKSFADVYLPLMLKADAVWDGLESNRAQLRQYGIEAEMIPRFGYLPELQEVIHKKNKDIDFLFYGSVTPHRKKMIGALQALGGNVVTVFDDAAVFRNDLIARARINLAPAQTPEISNISSRVLYLLNNKSVVVVERCSDQEWLEQCFPWADTRGWAGLCMETLRRPDLDRAADEYFERYRNLNLVDLFQPLLEKLSARLKMPKNIRKEPEGEPRKDPAVQAGELSQSDGGPEGGRTEGGPLHIQAVDGLKEMEGGRTYSGKGSVSIIIMPSGTQDHLAECLEALGANTPGVYEVLVMQTDQSADVIKKAERNNRGLPEPVTIESNGTTGPVSHLNKAFAFAKGEFTVLLRDDLLVSEEWLAGMMECHKNAPHAGIIGPMTGGSEIGGIQNIKDISYDPKKLDDYAVEFRKRFRYRRIPHRNIADFCMLFNRNIVDKLGFFDEAFASCESACADYCLRTELEGYRNCIAGDVFIHCYGSRRFKGNRIDNGAATGRNRKIFREKWSGVDYRSPEGKKLAPLLIIDKIEAHYMQGKIEEAVKIGVAGMRRCADSKDICYSLTERLIGSKYFEQAWDIVTQMIAVGDDPAALALMGYCREGLGFDPDAEEFADRALSLDAGLASAMNLKGILAHKKGETEKAEEWFKKAVGCDPGYGEPYANLGVLDWTRGNRENTVRLIEKGFVLSPLLPDIAALYHKAAFETGSLENAEKYFTDAHRLYPEGQQIAFLLIDLLLRQEKYEKGMNCIQNTITRFDVEEGLLSAALAVREKLGVLKIRQGKKDTLSLCMIVRNEEKYLARCLNSVKDIADEMIVVDTGSTDRTMEIAAVFGASVFRIEWKDDFSEARNYSLSMASGEWILVLDGDEVIAERDLPLLREIIREHSARRVAFSFDTRNYTRNVSANWVENGGEYPEEAGSGWYPSSKVRLFPNRPEIRFVNPVHELVEPSVLGLKMKIKPSGVPVHHFGKLQEKKTLDKGKQYFYLGKEKLKRTGKDPGAVFELAVQANELGLYQEALELWEVLFALTPSDDRAYTNAVKSYAELGRLEEAVTAARKAVALKPSSKEAVFHLGLALFYSGAFAGALQYLEKYIQRDPAYPPVLALLSACYIVSDRMEEGYVYVKRLRKMGFNYAEYVAIESRKLFCFGQKEASQKLVAAALDTDNITLELIKFFSEEFSSSGEQTAG